MVDDLCELAARKDPQLKRFTETSGGLVLACQPRSVRWLFAAAGAPVAASHTQILHLQSAEATDLPQKREPKVQLKSADSPAESAGLSGGGANWHAWFPVIDFERCTNCLQCLSFCLFGVFGVSSAKRLQVEHPEGCKPNCPACARVCPEAAIIFPKCPAAAMNGSDPPEAGVPRAAMKVDVSALLGGNVYERLKDRNRKTQERFSAARDPQKALAERRQYLAELARDIPAEVLDSLPSLEELRRQADAARLRASQAMIEKKSD